MTEERETIIRYSAYHKSKFPTPAEEEKVCEMWGKEAKKLAIGQTQPDGTYIIKFREKQENE